MLSLILNLLSPITSFLKPYKLILYGILAAILIGLAWHYVSNYKEGREAVEQLKTAQAALDAELECTVGSECAARIKRSADEAAKAVAKAQQQAKDESEAQQKANEEKTRTEIQKQSKALADHYQNLFKIQSIHSPSCDEWSKQVNPCAMQ